MMLIRTYFFVSFIFVTQIAFAQKHKIDLAEIILTSTSNTKLIPILDAHSLYLKGKSNKALKILKNSQNNEAIYENCFFIGFLELEQQKYTQAIQNFNQAIKFKETANAYFYRAVAYSNLKNYNTALRDYHSAIKLDTLMYAAYNNIALIKLENQGTGDLHQRDLEQSKTMLLKSAEREQNDKLVYFNLGLVCMSLNQFNESLTYLNKAVILDAFFVKAIYSRALTNFYLHRYTDALADFYTCKNFNYNIEECSEFIELIEKIVVAMQR